MLLERLAVKTFTSDASTVRSQRSCSNNETAYVLSRKGNEGLSSRDPHICYFCQKVFLGRNSLRIHFESFHRIMSCDLCSEVHDSKQDLKEHMKVVHIKKEIFICNVCGFKASVASILKKHKMIHGEKVQCLVCKKYVTSLMSHMRAHEPKESCSLCQKKVNKGNMKRHMKSHQKTHQCTSCNETFEWKEELRR